MANYRYKVPVIEVPKKEKDPINFVLNALSGIAKHPYELVIDASHVLKPAKLTDEGIRSWYQATQARKTYHFGVPDSRTIEARRLAEQYVSEISEWVDQPTIVVWDRNGTRNVLSNRRL